MLIDKYSKLDSYNNLKIPFVAKRDRQKSEFTINSCLEDIKCTFLGKIIYNCIIKSAESAMEENADIGMKNNAREMLLTMPLRNIVMSG